MNRIPVIKRWAKGSEDAPKKAKKKEKSKKPSNSNFKQQRLRACQPILTPIPVITTFLVIGLVFVPLGAVLLVTSNNVREVEKRYDDICKIGTVCNVPIHVSDKMDSPILYYKLTNFYQNHRRYVKSRNDAQLRGYDVSSWSDIADCDPVKSKDGSSSSKNFYLPCGLIARSFFNDTFIMRDEDGEIVPWHKEGIAWDSDLDHKFHNPPQGFPGIRVIRDFEDEDFIVWMRTAGLPTFKKPYRIIHGDLSAGTYNVTINNVFPTDDFDGKKYLVLSEVSWMGGKNPFLGYAYIIVGSICIILGLLFALRHIIKPRKLGDVKYLNWDK